MTFEDIEKSGLYLGKVISMQKKSILLMLDMLVVNESVLLITNCNLKSQPGVVTLTNKRIIFTSKVLFTSIKKEALLENITSINSESMFLNKITITSYNRDVFTISSIDKVVGEKFVQLYNSLKNDNSLNSQQVDQPSSLTISDLEKLVELRDKGIISVDDFEQKKKQILGL